MIKITHFITALSLSCIALPAQAISVFTSESGFLNQLALDGFSFTTIDFEDQSSGQTFNSGDSINGASFSFPMTLPLIIDDFFPTTSGNNFLGVDDNPLAFYGGDSFNVTTGETLRAAGLYVIGEPNTNLAGDFTLSTNLGDSVSNIATPDQLLVNGDGDAAGDAFFIGLIADDPSEWFTSFNFSSLSANYVFNIDDITYGTTTLSAIPLPATAWLFAGALFGWFGFERQRFGKQKS